MNNEVESRLKEIIIKRSILKITPEEINDDSDLINDFSYDSISLIQLILDIEAKLGIELEDEELFIDELTKYRTLKAVIDIKLEQLGKTGT